MTLVNILPGRMIKKIIVLLVGLLVLSCHQQAVKPEPFLIKGSLLFKEISAIKQTNSPAQVHLFLEDTSLADTAPRIISEVIYHLPYLQQQVEFVLPFTPEAINKSAVYTLSVSVAVQNAQGEYIETYINKDAYPVLIQTPELSTPVVLHSIY